MMMIACGSLFYYRMTGASGMIFPEVIRQLTRAEHYQGVSVGIVKNLWSLPGQKINSSAQNLTAFMVTVKPGSMVITSVSILTGIPVFHMTFHPTCFMINRMSSSSKQIIVYSRIQDGTAVPVFTAM